MKPVKVLIVDDEIEFATTLAERLRLRGYDAKAVYCAEDTFAIAKSDTPDILLLDLRMPGMSGLEILMTVREFAPNIKVILLTGHIDLEEKIEGIRISNFDYLMKPVDINELTEKIDKAVGKQSNVG
ncbi:MAG: response regulator [Nitrospirae bacterium]|nr:response regulator [Nitrospirota bacterium]